MITVDSKPKILGMYLSDNKSLYNNIDGTQNSFFTNEGINYLPVLDLFDIKSNEDIILVDGKNRDKELSTYNRHISSKNLDLATTKAKRIDITQNDILLGPVDIVLNLTGCDISISLSNEYRKSYRPIESDPLSPYYGKLLLLSVQSFNNPKMIHNTFGINNYFESLLDRYKSRCNTQYEEMIDILTYLNDMWSTLKLKARMEEGSCIKVVTLIDLDVNEMLQGNNRLAYIRKKNMYAILDNIVNMPYHPGTDAVFNTGDIKGYLKNNSFVCYIVDNDDRISDRYINIAGSVLKIMKIKNPTLVNGLYIIRTNNNGSSTSDIICRLEDIDTNQYVFKSIEEALEGADIRSQYKDNLEKTKQELEALRLEKANESLMLKSEFERKGLEIKIDYEKRFKEQTLAYEREIQEMKKALETTKVIHEENTLKNKSDFEYFKYDLDRKGLDTKSRYEENKYQRDSTLETIKTVGSVVGLLAGGFVLYNKLSKS